MRPVELPCPADMIEVTVRADKRYGLIRERLHQRPHVPDAHTGIEKHCAGLALNQVAYHFLKMMRLKYSLYVGRDLPHGEPAAFRADNRECGKICCMCHTEPSLKEYLNGVIIRPRRGKVNTYIPKNTNIYSFWRSRQISVKDG